MFLCGTVCIKQLRLPTYQSLMMEAQTDIVSSMLEEDFIALESFSILNIFISVN
jgi:hypothetical protein